jgi:hypothetical protein
VLAATDAVISPWRADKVQVLDFARILADTDVLTSATDALDYLAAPHRFDHALWARLGDPRPPSTDDLDEARLLGRTSPRPRRSSSM